MTAATAILQMICPDQPGLVRELSGWVASNGGNIVHADHHSDQGAGLFLSRIEWQLPGFGLPREAIGPAVRALAERLGGDSTVTFSDDLPPAAIFVSKQDHCLLDLLWRVRTGELPMRVPLVIANHPDLAPIAEEFGARFVVVPISADTRQQAEATHLELLAEHGIELVVLAKYMQVLSPAFLAAFDPPDAFHRVINIHHSFLPAFVGANPYRQAFERGVKLIGATAHFVTEELDAGPIIAQDVIGVDHTYTPERMAQAGRDVEKLVLARAVRLVLEERVFLHGGRTVVFA